MARIRFDEESLWMIRSFGDHTKTMFYYQSPFDWTAYPSDATLFRSFECAEVHMISCRQTHGDEDDAIYEVVPYAGELRKSKPPKQPFQEI